MWKFKRVPRVVDSRVSDDKALRAAFDVDYYLSNNPDVAQAKGIDPVEHYCDFGWKEGRDPTGDFSTNYYLKHNSDVADAKINPFLHYLKFGKLEGRAPSSCVPNVRQPTSLSEEISVVSLLFDTRFYLARYPDIAANKLIDPIKHYCQSGWKEGRDPSAGFSTSFYLSANNDVALSGVNPFYHFVKEGRAQGRAPTQITGQVWRDDFVCWEDVKREIRELAPLLMGNAPEVSVIVPVYNQFHYTLRCIWSLLKAGEKTRFQIIIADDCSSDETESFFQSVDGLSYLRNEKNLGFLKTCNKAAKFSTAPYLFFLNNDTALNSGAIDALVSTFVDLPNAGLVGSKLIYPDGRLQEAGGVLWKNGGALNIGRGLDPEHPAFNYRRDVDFISGAAIMIRRELWNDIGGFDLQFAPAYCEDGDLAMRVRSLGWRVIYQPASTVVHFEGVSSGRSINEGVKAHQPINLQRLYDKWSFGLETHNAEKDVNETSSLFENRPHILIVDENVPEPENDAGSVVAFWYMRILVNMGYRVTFLPCSLRLNGHHGRLLQSIGVEVLFSPYVSNVESYLNIYGSQYDIFLLYRVSSGGKLAGNLKKMYPSAKVIFNTVDLHHLRLEREAVLSDAPSEILARAQDIKMQELTVIKYADETILLSSFEQQILRDQGYHLRTCVIPLVHESRKDIPGRNERHGIAFVGGFRHPPNVDAVLYFVEKIYPILREKAPEIEVHIVGSHPPVEITSLDVPGVIVHGFVADLEGFLQERVATIAPLRFGAGMKGKVVTSMGEGVPVVSTSIGIEGMGVTAGADVMVGDTDAEFAESIVRLYSDADLWRRISKNGVDFVERNFSPSVVMRKLWELMARIEAPPFFGKCTITGYEQGRRFLDDRLDSLSPVDRHILSSERVAAKALVNLSGAMVDCLDRVPDNGLVDIYVHGEMPELKASIKRMGASASVEEAKIAVIRLEESSNYVDSLETILPTLRQCQRLIVVCSSNGKFGLEREEESIASRELVDLLEEQEWLVRLNPNPLPESMITKTILIEAMMK